MASTDGSSAPYDLDDPRENSMTVQVIPTSSSMGRGLINHDPRNRDYPVRRLLQPLPRVNKAWRRGYAYDQAQTFSCVGQTVKGLLNSAPWSADVDYEVRSAYDALDLYDGGRLNDEYDGEAYDGTSALGVMRYALSRGLLVSYDWCFGLDDVLDHLSQRGPVGIGIGWTESMFTPMASGLLTVSGEDVGGHEVELTGIDVTHREVIAMNSWGIGWGVSGRFRLSWDDLGSRLADSGDAVTVTGVGAHRQEA